MATRGQALGAWDERIRRSVVAAGLDPSAVLASEYEWVGYDKVSVVVMDPQTRKRQFRAIIDLVPEDIDVSTKRSVWILSAADWDRSEVIDVFASPEGAESALEKRHKDYLEYVKGYMGEDPTGDDAAWLAQVEEQPTLGVYGHMEITEWKVEA